MRVRNVHQRLLPAPPEEAGFLIDSLASPEDRLWPRERWPAIRLDAPLPKARYGAHGPIAYTVDEYSPGRSLRFRFTRPRGFEGTHGFTLEPALDGQGTRLLHVLQMRLHGWARLTWPLVFRPLHDALLEDALDCAERALGAERPMRAWTPRVRVLRRVLRPRRRRTTPSAGEPMSNSPRSVRR